MGLDVFTVHYKITPYGREMAAVISALGTHLDNGHVTVCPDDFPETEEELKEKYDGLDWYLQDFGITEMPFEEFREFVEKLREFIEEEGNECVEFSWA